MPRMLLGNDHHHISTHFLVLCLFCVLMWPKLLAGSLRPVCLVLFACMSPVSGLPSPAYMVMFTVKADLEGKRDAFVGLSDKRKVSRSIGSFYERWLENGVKPQSGFQQNYSIPNNNISVIGMDLEICWWPCLPKLRQPWATEQARMMSCSWIWGDSIKGSRIKLGRGSSCYVQFAL